MNQTLEDTIVDVEVHVSRSRGLESWGKLYTTVADRARHSLFSDQGTSISRTPKRDR